MMIIIIMAAARTIVVMASIQIACIRAVYLEVDKMKSICTIMIAIAIFVLFGTNYAFAQQAYNLTVKVPSQPENSSVLAEVLTKNGYAPEEGIITGSASHTFSIPANEGGFVQVCISHAQYTVDQCKTFTISSRNGTNVSVQIAH
jgi:hypothetical protein